jgi:hypothetical protein
MNHILLIDRNKNNEVGVVSECKDIILGLKFVEATFWRTLLLDYDLRGQGPCLAYLCE